MIKKQIPDEEMVHGIHEDDYEVRCRMAKRPTRLTLLNNDLLCDFTDIVLRAFPNLSPEKQSRIFQGIKGTADAQLAHCQKEHDQIVKEERQAITRSMRRTIIGEERSCPKGTEIWFLFKEDYDALKRGELPEGIKIKKEE